MLQRPLRAALLAGALVLALSVALVAGADDAQAAPIGGARLSIAPDVFVGFGCGYPPPPRRVVVVRRSACAPAPVVVRRTYVSPYRYAPYYSPYYAPYYAPYYVRPYYGPRAYVGFGIGGSYHHHHRHGTSRVIGRRR